MTTQHVSKEQHGSEGSFGSQGATAPGHATDVVLRNALTEEHRTVCRLKPLGS